MGSGTKRDGGADATETRAGIVAQKLRHLEVLLVAPWRLTVGGGGSKHLPGPVDVRVANPVSFVVQKLLIHADRKPTKRAQDVLYLHDTIQLFGGALKELNDLWRSQVRGALSRNQRTHVRDMQKRLFASVTDVVREASLIPADRFVRPEDMRMVCADGLATMLAEE